MFTIIVKENSILFSMGLDHQEVGLNKKIDLRDREIFRSHHYIVAIR